jgi:diguanylate cyclase (GGDEF)-like protein/PAS domain S-box-containing protein
MLENPSRHSGTAQATVVPPILALDGDNGYERLFEAIPTPMWVYDPDSLRFLTVNRAALEQYGYDRDDYRSLTVLDLCTPEDVGSLMADLAQVGDAGPTSIRRHRRKDGTVVNVETTVTPVAFSSRSAELLLARDVGAEQELAEALRERDASLREAQLLARLGRWEWDLMADGTPAVGRWSSEMYEMFGLDPEKTETTYATFLERVHPEDRELARAGVEETLRTGRPFATYYRVLVPGGGVRWLQSRGRLERQPGEVGGRILGHCQDITPQKASEEALTRLAFLDALTGLSNRAIFMDRLALAMRRLGRRPAGGTDVTVLFIDIDHFKMVNDRLGHSVGDELLLAIASRLRLVVRSDDTVARLGGDEFALVCEQLGGPAEAVQMAERILETLAGPIVVGGHEVVTTASVGVAFTRDPETTPDSLLRDADAAMCRAKEDGRNRYDLFDPVIRARNVARQQRAQELETALDAGQLRIVYQLEVEPAGETPTGFEALVRWQHPVHGLLPPSEFIGIAEDNGFVVDLGAWVLLESCREAVRRRRERPWEPTLSLSVNLSARQVNDPGLLPMVAAVLADTGIDPALLCLEITESVLLDDAESSLEVLRRLKALGVKLAVDDFGTGYSSLRYLSRFPVDIVKIDRSFVAGLGIDPAAGAIVAAVINLSHALGFTAVAEGVETPEQVVVLQSLGCDRAQGYYWSEPVPADQIPLKRPMSLPGSALPEAAPLPSESVRVAS